MTIGQLELISNYTSLKEKTNSENLAALLKFCSIFQSDDEELFKEFLQIYDGINRVDYDKIISLFAKRYNLDEKEDIEKIMYLFVQNSINNGVVYHLNSSANFESIMSLGMGLSAIGLQTEERKDYETLKKTLPEDIFKRLLPFYGEKNGSKLFYSCTPILNARYGDRPEWLKELKLNSFILEDGSKEQFLVNQILKKYDEKYYNASKVLFIFPNPKVYSETSLENELKNSTPKNILYKCCYYLEQKDMFTNIHISPSYIIALELKTQKLYAINKFGEIEPLLSNSKTSNIHK